MGLSYRPGGASWSYIGFGELRRQVADFEGIPNLEAWWNSFDRSEMDTPLYEWLIGADVHGFFSASDCERMVPRFQAVLKHFGDRLSDYDRSNLEALTAGMQHCIEHGCAMSWG